jgi:DDE superfamily endonuclease
MWRVEVTERRTHTEYAACGRWLVDEAFPDAPRIRIVQDHLSTHDPASLSATFPPEEAHRIPQRLEFHYPPVHGSWLNMAEMEIGIFERGCLSRPLEGLVDLCQRAAAWEAERNAARRTIQWQFTTPDARRKLHRLYPTLKCEVD